MLRNLKKYFDNFQIHISVLISIGQLISSILIFCDKISKYFWIHPFLYIVSIWVILVTVLMLPIYSKKISLLDINEKPIIMKQLSIPRKTKWLFVSFSTFLALLSILFVYHKLFTKSSNTLPPAPWLNKGSIINESNASNVNPVATSKDKVQIRWEFVNDYSSHKSYKEGDSILSISPDDKIAVRLLSKKGKKEDNQDDLYYDKIYFWLKNRCINQNQHYGYFLGYTKYDVNLVDLTFSHPEIINDLCPNNIEYKKLSEIDKDIVKRWFINYIGQWMAKINITIDNSNGDKDLSIIKFVYDIKKIGIFKAEIPSKELPEFAFYIPYKIGRFEYALASQGSEITVKKGESFSLYVNLCPDKNCPVSPSWRGIVSLITNLGEMKIGYLNFSSFNPSWNGYK